MPTKIWQFFCDKLAERKGAFVYFSPFLWDNPETLHNFGLFKINRSTVYLPMKLFSIPFALAFFCAFQGSGQAFLPLDRAISVALENNYQIKIAKNREQIAQNDNTKGNAGFLPTVTATAIQNFNSNNINQEFFAIGTTRRDPLVQSGVKSRNNNVGINMVWTLYDGMGMFVAEARQQQVVKLNGVNIEATIENTVAQVGLAYYEIIRQKQRLKAFKNALDISMSRLTLAKDNFEAGATSKADYLSAQVDFNADKAVLLGQEQVLQNTKINLNALLVRDLDENFSVPDTIIIRKDLLIDGLKRNVETQNPALILANLNRELSQLDYKLVNAQKYPTVDLVSGFNYSTINNQAGFGVQAGKQGALSLGARLSFNVFDGYNQKRREQNAKINVVAADNQAADLKIQLLAALQRNFNNYQNSVQLVQLEAQNLKIAQQNAQIAFERYRVGNSTSIEFREAQRNAVATETRLIEAAFNTKSNEIELLRLSSSILEEVK